MRQIHEAQILVVTIVGKTWLPHVAKFSAPSRMRAGHDWRHDLLSERWRQNGQCRRTHLVERLLDLLSAEGRAATVTLVETMV